MEYDMLIMMLEKMFALPIVIMLLSSILRVIKDCMVGNGWKVMKTEVKEEKKEINIDKDLQKYFNYKG